MKRADYGLDAPGVILGAIVIGVTACVGAIWFKSLAALGAALVLLGLLTYWSSRRGKLSIAQKLLDGLALKGDEQVLDVGCGRGLLLVNAAKRLRSGRAVGLDLWVQADQLDNRRDATLQNAAAEGVSDRVEVVDGDMRQMPFAPAAFDLVISNLAIHNVPGANCRHRAIAEIARVLKPGGRVVLIDLAFTQSYCDWLRAAGLTEVRRQWPARWFFPPLGVVTAQRPPS